MTGNGPHAAEFPVMDGKTSTQDICCRALPDARSAALAGPVVAPADHRGQPAVQRVHAPPHPPTEGHGEQGQHLRLRQGSHALHISTRGA